jgi:hypothetical protein
LARKPPTTAVPQEIDAAIRQLVSSPIVVNDDGIINAFTAAELTRSRPRERKIALRSRKNIVRSVL